MLVGSGAARPAPLVLAHAAQHNLPQDLSDDQQDISRAKGMVDELYQGWAGSGTQDVVLSSAEYLSNVRQQPVWWPC